MLIIPFSVFLTMELLQETLQSIGLRWKKEIKRQIGQWLLKILPAEEQIFYSILISVEHLNKTAEQISMKIYMLLAGVDIIVGLPTPLHLTTHM